MISVLGVEASRDELRIVPVPHADEGGSRWKPIQHGVLADLIVRNLKRRGFGIKEERWSLSNDGKRLIGAIDVGIARDKRKELGADRLKGINYALGIRHSNDQKYALTFSVGATVLVCHNGVISGEFIVSKRHTINTDLKRVIRKGVDVFSGKLSGIPEVVNRFRQIEYENENSNGAERALITAGMEHVLPWSRVGKVAREYYYPVFEEFAPRNGWSLYNAATHVAQEISPERQMYVMDRFRDVIFDTVN